VREFDFDIGALALSGRASKGITVTKWAVKDVKRVDPV
jgi:topoisomerase-4 subunit A